MDPRNTILSRVRQLGIQRILRQQKRTNSTTELRYLNTTEPPKLHPKHEDTSHSTTFCSSGSHDYGVVDGSDSAPVPTRPTRKLTQGWRFGAMNCAVSATVIFLINRIVTIWGSTKPSSAGVLYQGDCEKVRRMNTGLHFLINLLSAVLLSSSNYCMQCLSAPTRSEVDRAHAQSVWLDIGIPSVRNLRHISWKRAAL
jgi:hypothetical protein